MNSRRSRVSRALVASVATVLAVPLLSWVVTDRRAAAEPIAAAAAAEDLRGDITFSAPSGTFTSSVTVTLGTTAAGAQIRYTTDGSAPTAASQTPAAQSLNAFVEQLRPAPEDMTGSTWASAGSQPTLRPGQPRP